MSHHTYIRILALGFVDVILSLPLGVLKLTSRFVAMSGPFVFWPGWSEVHSSWTSVKIRASAWKTNKWLVFQVRTDQWICPFLAVLVFSVCGVHKEARSKYRSAFWTAMKILGFKPPAKPEVSDIRFDSAAVDAESMATNAHHIGVNTDASGGDFHTTTVVAPSINGDFDVEQTWDQISVNSARHHIICVRPREDSMPESKENVRV